jgi:C1A family cysteine protease
LGAKRVGSNFGKTTSQEPTTKKPSVTNKLTTSKRNEKSTPSLGSRKLTTTTTPRGLVEQNNQVKNKTTKAPKFITRTKSSSTTTTTTTTPAPPDMLTSSPLANFYDIPKSLDYSRECTPVKDQYGCGSCWAFSSLGVIEFWQNREGKYATFSEQGVIDCNEFGYSCDGGEFD